MGCVQSAEEREAAEKRRFLKAQKEVQQKLIYYLCMLQFRFYMNGVCFDSTNRHGVDIVSCSFYYNRGSDYVVLGASRKENAYALTQALINGANNLPPHFSSLYLGLRGLKENLPNGMEKYVGNPKSSMKKAHAYILRQHWLLVEHVKKLFSALDGNDHEFNYIRRYVNVCNGIASGMNMTPDGRVFVVPTGLIVPYTQDSYVKTYHGILVPAAYKGFSALSDVLDKVHRYLGVGAMEFSKHSPKFVEDRVMVFSFVHRNLAENVYFGVDEMREAKMTRMLIDRARASLTKREQMYYTKKQKILPGPFSSFYQSIGKIQVMLNDSFTQMMETRRHVKKLERMSNMGKKEAMVIDIEKVEEEFKLARMSEMWNVVNSALRVLNHDLNVVLAEGEEKLKQVIQGYLEVFHEIEIVAGNSAA